MQARPEGAGAPDAPDVLGARRDRGSLAGTAAVLVVIALQIAIPLVALLQPPPQKFGFQMYSGLGAVTATVIDVDGREHTVTEFDQLMGKYRPDIDWLPLLPEALCESFIDAVDVRVEQSGRVRSIECG
ncbi:hypothetical protein [Agromyces humatus]|uniref:hypothetical protein n=1 Tax=Agromyces humatus TaxID=279573 RepID=UPI001E58B326|nr:hypothetical protein [Agromyces humatus]